MKHFISILLLCLVTGCATHKTTVKTEKAENYPAIAGTTVSVRTMPEVRNPEIVKSYPVGRYTDPDFPEAMHERHTLYRSEQSSDWNYRPNAPYALPMGPVVMVSDPSPSYFVKTNEEERNARQRAYAAALQEENAAMKKRIESLKQEAGKVPELRQQVEDLKNQIETVPVAPTPSPPPSSTNSTSEGWKTFGKESEPQKDLITQMRLNDQCIAALEALERSRCITLSDDAFLSRLSQTVP